MLGMISYRLGRSLQWDGAKEQILNDKEANHLLRAITASPGYTKSLNDKNSRP